MKNEIRTQITQATAKAIESMDAYKTQADRYTQLTQYATKIQDRSLAKLDSMEEVGLKALNIKDGKTWLAYAVHTDNLICKVGEQVAAVISRYL